MRSEILNRCWFLAGPTASGKTAASLELAERIGAEIVAMDSMTLYRGMDIGTAKPNAFEQSRVRHHLIDVITPDQEFSVADYLMHAERACHEILDRRRIPLFVGGTGLYLRSLLRGVFEGPSADWTIRQRLEEQARAEGPQTLHQQLRRVDPKTADRLHPNDERRVIRALEVYELTGQPLSQVQQHGPLPDAQRPTQVFWLSPPRDWLYRRIDERVETMFSQGLIDEVQTLLRAPRPISHTARQALGYKELIDWFENNADVASQSTALFPAPAAVSLQGLKQSIQTRTRQFSKRQHTWFRNLPECRAVTLTGNESPADIAQRVIRMTGE